MTIPKFKQVIVPHDRGSDVLATKIGLDRMGHHDVNLGSNRAGPAWEHSIRAVQHNHGLRVDGLYGPKTHELVAPHFTEHAVELYKEAKLRHRSAYANPFAAATSLQIGRIDEGVDYHGKGPIHALGDMVVVGLGGSGWPGGHYINARLTSGRHAGRFYYLAEGVVPKVGVGEHVKAGALLAEFAWDAAPGLFPGIEMGWGSSITNLTHAAITHQTGPRPFNNTPPGLAFCRFLHAIGCPAPPVGPGPEFV